MKAVWSGLCLVGVLAMAILGWLLLMALVVTGVVGLFVADKLLENSPMSGVFWAFIGVVLLIANAVNRMPPELPPVHGDATEADDVELREKNLL